ncbi:site-specific integrase [Acidobacteria bacterium AH-259-A15]|nr:site-specific integrase [Acidobacteria bacterium AH-259-A15]
MPAAARAKLEAYLTLREVAIVAITQLRAVYEDFSEAKRGKIEKSASWRRPDPRWLFLNRYGSQISRQHIHGLLRKVAEHARVHYGAEVNLYPHRLRHAFALEKLKKTGDPVLVAQLLGHRSLQHVARYTHRREEEIEEILEG